MPGFGSNLACEVEQNKSDRQNMMFLSLRALGDAAWLLDGSCAASISVC